MGSPADILNEAFPQDILDAIISAVGAGDTQVVAAQTGFKIRGISGLLIASAPCTVKFQSDSGGTAVDLTGPIPLAANTGFLIHWVPRGHWETVAGKKLNLNVVGAANVGGWLNYRLKT
jgi:hypothetical protein